MKKFFITVICIAIAAMVGYGIKYAVTPINTQKLSYITQENAINTNGFIIRDEWVMYSRSAGTAYHSVAEGERVSKDSTIGSLFYGDVSDDSIKELTVVDNKIKKTKTEKSEESISTLDSNTLENNIYERENDIIDAAQDNDILSIAKYKKDINSLSLCCGFRNMSFVDEYSMSSPSRKKAVRCEIRLACCIERVTSNKVYCSLRL